MNILFSLDDVLLTPLPTDDAAIEVYYQWLNNRNPSWYADRLLGTIDMDEITKWVLGSNVELRCAIFSKEEKLMLGLCTVKMTGLSAYINLLFGSVTSWDIADKVLDCLYTYARDALRAKRAEIQCCDRFATGMHAITKAGFHECGKRTNAMFWHGEYASIILFERYSE